MASQKTYIENAPGAFHVEYDLCITCRAPEAIAPDIIGFFEDTSGTGRQSHCYFKKQPETKDEIARTIKALSVSCCGAYHYAGSDPHITEQLIKIDTNLVK